MRYFNYLSAAEEQQIFLKAPQTIAVQNQSLLEHALGATLYMSATSGNIAEEIMNGKLTDLMSIILYLEGTANNNEENVVVNQITQLALAVAQERVAGDDVPLIFVRIQEVDQMRRIIEGLADKAVLLTGFVFPQFTADNGWVYFDALAAINEYQEKTIYGMPILETPEFIYLETRDKNLVAIKMLLDQYRQLVLNVRIGAMDLSALFGIRRPRDMTIYDVAVVGHCIADVINVFIRSGSNYVVPGPAWELYSSGQVPKSQWYQNGAGNHWGLAANQMKKNIINSNIEGLIHEVMLDKANGLIGKTIIHAAHIKPVQALCVVTHEEYMDACSILDSVDRDSKVIRAHTRWAETIMMKAQIYGVFHERCNFTDLLT